MATKLSRINLALLVLIIAINAYIIVWPFSPLLWYWWQQHQQVSSQLNQKMQQVQSSIAQPSAASQPNQVIVPSMVLDQPILEGSDTYAVLRKGIWRWPKGSTPDKGSNTILIGHRFTYKNPHGVFYFLDKVRVGDQIGIIWSNRYYQYRVSNIQIVPPTGTSILNPTTKPTLTLYTCTPVWWPKNRLIVTALLEGNL